MRCDRTLSVGCLLRCGVESVQNEAVWILDIGAENAEDEIWRSCSGGQASFLTLFDMCLNVCVSKLGLGMVPFRKKFTAADTA